MMLKISIITACFNASKTISETLDSVGRQSHQSIEHIIVDGASTDDTMSIIENYRGRLSVVISEPDQGVYDAMNKWPVRAA